METVSTMLRQHYEIIVGQKSVQRTKTRRRYQRWFIESSLGKKAYHGRNLGLYSDQHLSSAMVRVTQCNTLVFLPELNSRENFPQGSSISAPNNDEFKHGAVVYGYIGAGY